MKIFKTLFQHYKDKADTDIQLLAKDTLKKFRESRFTSKAVVSFEKWAKPDDLEVYEFLLSFGSIIVPEMVTLFGKGERPEIQDLVLKLLNRFPEVTCLEAKRRFRDPRPSFVINMLTLVRKIGTEKDAPIIKKLLEHHDSDVRLKALETLIDLRDPDVPDVIRNFLGTIDTKDKLKVIEIIGNYKVNDLVEDLISGISRWSLFKSQYELNEVIITALGNIGDPMAVPVLEKLAKCKWAIWPRRLESMKRALFQSLEGYEKSQISKLLKIGRTSEDEQVRQVCQNIGNRNLSAT